MITAKPAAVASSGTASPTCWASAPEAAGPATPPTPAAATDPPRAGGPPAAAPASQHRPAVHTMPYPAPNASRAASRAGKPPDSACAAVAAAISRPAARVTRRGPNRSDIAPAGTDTTRVASPVAPSTMPCSNPDRPNRRAYTGMTGTSANWAAALTPMRTPIRARNRRPPAPVLAACTTMSSLARWISWHRPV